MLNLCFIGHESYEKYQSGGQTDRKCIKRCHIEEEDLIVTEFT